MPWDPLYSHSSIFLLTLFIVSMCESFINGSNLLEKSIGEMTGSVLSTRFWNVHCVGIITESNTDILDYVPKHLSIYVIQIGDELSIPNLEETDTLDPNTLNNATLNFETLLIESLNQDCPIYIIQVSNPKAAIHCFARASRRAMFRANRKYLVLPTFNTIGETDIHSEIFTMKEMNYMPDILIATVKYKTKEINRIKSDISLKTSLEDTYTTNNIRSLNQKECTNNYLEFRNIEEINFKIELRTLKFTGNESSENVLVDVWIPGNCDNRGKFVKFADLYPDKTKDIEGKQLTLVTWYYPPFIILDLDANPPLMDGIEFRVVREFLRYINATFRIAVDPENYWGDVFDNGTGNGVLGFVAMDKADIGFSAFYAWPSSFKVVDFPASHMRSSVTILTPRPKLLPGWVAPLLPFSGAMWGAVGACLLCSTYTLYKLQTLVDKWLGNPLDRINPFSQLDYTAFNTYGMLVNQAPTFAWDSNIPRHVPARHFVAWFQFFGEVISDTYNAGLASVLSSPRYEPPIETIEDLAERNVIWAGNHVAWIWSIEEDNNPDLQTITKNFRCLTNERMNEIGQKTGDLAFGIERLQGGHFTTEPHVNEETVIHRRIMKGTLYWSHLYILLRKGSPYMRRFNTLVSRIRDAGLPLYWEGEVIRRYMSERLQIEITASRILDENREPAKLSLDQLQGVFFLLVLGETVALIAFIIELSLYRKRNSNSLVSKQLHA